MRVLQEVAYWLTIWPRLKRLKKLLPNAKIYPCGSRYVCNPPVMHTDVDFLVYSEAGVSRKLEAAGWDNATWQDYCGNISADDSFVSWRKGSVNLIVMTSKRGADRFNVATHISRAYNIRPKYARVLVYEALRRHPEWSAIKAWLADYPKLITFLENANGANGNAVIAIYRAQHGLTEEVNDDY